MICDLQAVDHVVNKNKLYPKVWPRINLCEMKLTFIWLCRLNLQNAWALRREIVSQWSLPKSQVWAVEHSTYVGSCSTVLASVVTRWVNEFYGSLGSARVQ